jgi:hypothetical protein
MFLKARIHTYMMNDLIHVMSMTIRNKCAACFRQYNRMEHLVEHMKVSYHSVHEPRCGVCGKHCRSLESLREHLIGTYVLQKQSSLPRRNQKTYVQAWFRSVLTLLRFFLFSTVPCLQGRCPRWSARGSSASAAAASASTFSTAAPPSDTTVRPASTLVLLRYDAWSPDIT